MNKTHELLLNIKNLVLKDSSVLEQLSADDIISCVYVELEGVKQLYNEAQMREITLLLKNLSAMLADRLSNKDTQGTVGILDRIIEIHNAFPDSGTALDFIEEANFNKAYIRHVSQGTAIVLGDSHVNYFSGNEELSFMPIGRFIDTCEQINGLPLTCLHLGASLAFTSDQKESSSGFREKLDFLLGNFIMPESTIITCLGEIDIRAHVFKEVEKQGKSYQQIVDDILGHYETFLLQLKNQGYNVACWGPIASQKDETPVMPEFPRFGTEIERNKATEYFNKQLENWCAAQNIPFMTMFYEMIDENYETKEEYLSSDRFHLGQYSFETLAGSRFMTDIIDKTRDLQ